MDETKICPFCAEEIKAAAIRCRYCQSDLVSTASRELPTEPVQGPSPDAGMPTKVAPKAETRSSVIEPTSPRSRRPRLRARGRAAPGSAPVPLRWLVLCAALSMVVAGVVGFFLWDLNRMTDTVEARTSGQATGAEYVEKILSYDHKRLDQDVAEATELMTGGFEKEYTQTIEQVRELATTEKSAVEARVVASSVVQADDSDRVEVLLFVNQATTGDQVKEPRVDLNRVLVTLVRDGDQGWLVSGLDAL